MLPYTNNIIQVLSKVWKKKHFTHLKKPPPANYFIRQFSK